MSNIIMKIGFRSKNVKSLDKGARPIAWNFLEPFITLITRRRANNDETIRSRQSIVEPFNYLRFNIQQQNDFIQPISIECDDFCYLKLIQSSVFFFNVKFRNCLMNDGGGPK